MALIHRRRRRTCGRPSLTRRLSACSPGPARRAAAAAGSWREAQRRRSSCPASRSSRSGVGAERMQQGRPADVLRERVIDDFEGNTEARYVALGEAGSTAAIGRVAFRRVACDRSGAPGHCLRLRYRFEAEGSGEVGLRILLGDVDASGFDRVAFWIKGDASTGFSTRLKVGFRQVPSPSGLVETGSQVVEGIGPEWRRIEVPLNRMSGIQDWSHLGEFFVSLESRRMTAPAGAYFLDDVVLLRTGRPGPSISDRVVAHKKEAWEAALGGPAEGQAADPDPAARMAATAARGPAGVAAFRPAVPPPPGAGHLARARRVHAPRQRPADRPRPFRYRLGGPGRGADRRLHQRHQHRVAPHRHRRRLRARLPLPHRGTGEDAPRTVALSGGWRATGASTSTTTTPRRWSGPATSSPSSTPPG